jgi:hypothetical protein
MFNKKKKAIKVASDMRWFIGSTPCTCIPTEEYAEYERQLSENITPEAKLLWGIDNEMPDDTISIECERCQLIGQYDDLIGEDAAEKEWNERNKLTDEQLQKVLDTILNSINLRKGNA